MYFGEEDETTGERRSFFSWDNIIENKSVVGTLLDETPTIALSNTLPGGYTHFYVLDSELDTGYEVSDPQWFNTQTTGDAYSQSEKTQFYGDDFDSVRAIRVNTEALAPDEMLEVRLSGVGDLTVVDDEGNELSEHNNEIDGGDFAIETPTYSGDETPTVPAPETQVARVFDVESDFFTISISGDEAGQFFLTIYQMGTNGHSALEEFSGNLKKNKSETYTVFFGGNDGSTLIDQFIAWIETGINDGSKNQQKRFAAQLSELQDALSDGAIVVKNVPSKLLQKWASGFSDKNQFPLAEAILTHLLK